MKFPVTGNNDPLTTHRHHRDRYTKTSTVVSGSLLLQVLLVVSISMPNDGNPWRSVSKSHPSFFVHGLTLRPQFSVPSRKEQRFLAKQKSYTTGAKWLFRHKCVGATFTTLCMTEQEREEDNHLRRMMDQAVLLHDQVSFVRDQSGDMPELVEKLGLTDEGHDFSSSLLSAEDLIEDIGCVLHEKQRKASCSTPLSTLVSSSTRPPQVDEMRLPPQDDLDSQQLADELDQALVDFMMTNDSQDYERLEELGIKYHQHQDSPTPLPTLESSSTPPSQVDVMGLPPQDDVDAQQLADELEQAMVDFMNTNDPQDYERLEELGIRYQQQKESPTPLSTLVSSSTPPPQITVVGLPPQDDDDGDDTQQLAEELEQALADFMSTNDPKDYERLEELGIRYHKLIKPQETSDIAVNGDNVLSKEDAGSSEALQKSDYALEQPEHLSSPLAQVRKTGGLDSPEEACSMRQLAQELERALMKFMETDDPEDHAHMEKLGFQYQQRLQAQAKSDEAEKGGLYGVELKTKNENTLEPLQKDIDQAQKISLTSPSIEEAATIPATLPDKKVEEVMKTDDSQDHSVHVDDHSLEALQNRVDKLQELEQPVLTTIKRPTSIVITPINSEKKQTDEELTVETTRSEPSYLESSQSVSGQNVMVNLPESMPNLSNSDSDESLHVTSVGVGSENTVDGNDSKQKMAAMDADPSISESSQSVSGQNVIVDLPESIPNLSHNDGDESLHVTSVGVGSENTVDGNDITQTMATMDADPSDSESSLSVSGQNVMVDLPESISNLSHNDGDESLHVTTVGVGSENTVDGNDITQKMAAMDAVGNEASTETLGTWDTPKTVVTVEAGENDDQASFLAANVTQESAQPKEHSIAQDQDKNKPARTMEDEPATSSQDVFNEEKTQRPELTAMILWAFFSALQGSWDMVLSNFR